MRVMCVVLFATLCACTTSQPPPASKPAPPAANTPPAPSPSSSSSTTPPPAGVLSRPLPNVNLSGYPPAFRDGFRDGCDSFRGNNRRDNSRFGTNNDYTIGWQDGFSICRRQGK